MNCNICTEKINKSNHKEVQCSFCDFLCCRTCVQRYLLSTTLDPHCMKCRHMWDREFIDRVCTKTFRDGDLRRYRENILFEREKALMPETQILVEREIEAERMDARAHTIQQEISSLCVQVSYLRREAQYLRENTVVERRKFVRKCPVHACRGFLSTQWKCGLCETHICSHCNDPLGTDHTCDEDAVKTMDLLKKDTRGCPQCGTMIHKLSGCSQMWCPDCNTAFDWNTGNIELGRIHNPHYFEFRARGGTATREHGDIPCGGIPDWHEISRLTGDTVVTQLYRLVIHVEQVVIPQFVPVHVDTTRSRMHYLRKNITEEEFKRFLQRHEKVREKNRDITNILRMFVDTCGDYLRQYVNEPTEDKKNEVKRVSAHIKVYANETLLHIMKRYGTNVPLFQE